MGSNCCKGDAAGKPLVRSSSSIYNRSRAGAKVDHRFKKSDDAGGVRLTISAARTGDSGVYTLQASNAAGKDTTRVRLEVSPDETPTGEDPPNFIRRLQDLTVKVGTRTRFLVEIVSSTECRVTWYRNERRLLEAERIALVRDGNFWCADISAVSVDDAGRWTCTAENVGGRASCSAHLNVLVPKAYKRPEFVEELRALLTEQGTVSLECKVVGVPTPVLRWFKDSREIKAGDVFALTANAEDPTSLGTYTCEAVNCMGRAYSSSKVHVVGRASRDNFSQPSSGGITPEPPPIFTKELEDQFVRICEPLTLSCHIVVPPWPRNVVWYNKEGKIEPSERYHVLEDGVGGYLLEVPSAEWPDEGEWKCVATSSGGRVGISTCYVSMDVPKNYRKPRFMENLQAVLTEEGLVSFECKVVGFPTPLLSWFKDGQELKPGDVYQLTGTNSLGSYCCIARNCMGQASSSAELTVEDIQNQLNEEEKLQLFSRNQAPKFLQGLKSVEAKIDEPFRFTIKVAIPPEPTVLWYRDDQPVDESCRCHHGKEERGVFFLDIQNLEFMDQAEWKCVAMNDYGHSVTSCFLKLIIPRHFKKPRFLENLQAILSDEGAVNLECKVIGVPQPVLKWYKDGEELKPGDIHRIISGQDGTCCLGTYTCEAQNCMGIAASSASLLGFEDSIKAKGKKKADEQALQRNLSLSTIHEERTSQMYDTPVGDMTLDEKGEISFSFDGKEVSVSLYETPDLTEEEALQIVEMYADQLSENVTEHNVVELPPLRFVKETSTSGNLLMEAIIIDVSPEYFTSPEEDLRTEADIEDISIADDNGPPQLSLDVDADGEDYLEKTIALLSDEKSDIPKKIDRKKSDSQRSAEDYFSLSRDQSLSEEKKDDDTQMLSESDLQSFASARSSGKPKSKSSKPSIEDGQESSDVTKTVLLRDDLQNQTIETDISAVKNKKTRLSSQSLRRSSSGSEKSLSKMKEDMPEIKPESIVNLAKIDLNKEKVKTAINGISVSLTEVINEIQILERDIILKSEFMSTAATASNSLEMINSLITPLSEIHSITDAIRETVEYSENITSLLNNLPESLQNLQHSLTIISKCIDVESENKTLVTKTCMSIIKKCGQQLHNIIKDINTTVYNECQFDEKIRKSNIETVTTDLINIINCSLDMVNSEENKKSERDGNVEEPTLESKHLHDTQKAIHDLRGSLRSLLFIVEEVDISKATSFLNIKKSEIILNDMSTPIQDLQSALEQIETLSVTESKSDLQKYNTEIIETAMESVLKLRTSFEKLYAEASNIEDKDVLSEVLNEIKFNIKKISIQLDELESKTGKFDILKNDNKLEALQKMAQILINLENNLARLENISSVKDHMTEFHKNLTKLLENVIESNDANKYFSLLEICDAVNRMNTSIKSIESNNELSLASINNTLKIIQTNISNNVFQPELNSSLMSSIAKALICIQETINKAEELSLNENLEDVKDLSIAKCEDDKVNMLLENIEQTIAAISNVISHETAKDMTLKKAIENVCPILVDLKYCIASLNVTSSDKNETLSDLESLSFSQSIANPLIELHQTISVISQVICENADSQDVSQLLIDYAKPLLDLCDTLEILQHDVVSQCIENEPHFDISSSIANVVENLKSCIVMIQEQPIIEGTDDMSTLDDISGIKTTADILSGDEFMIATVKENENVQFIERNLPSESGKVLQKLLYHITTLQNSDVLNVLEPVELREKSFINSFIIGSEEIRAQIESILHLTTMESNQEQLRFMNLSKLIEIIPLLKNMQQLLSDIDINTILTKTHITEKNAEKCFLVKENIQNFKNYLNYCLGIILPAIEITDNTVDVSTKIVSLRKSCEKLSSLFSKLEESIESHKEIKTEIFRLEETVKLFLEKTTYQNTTQIKNQIENLYKVIVIVQEELNQLASNKPELLSKENILLQIIHDVEKYIVALEQCNFVSLCDLNIVEKDVVVAKSKVSKEFINEEDSLMIYLKELMMRLEYISNQLLHEKKELESELLQEKPYEKIEKLDLELSKIQLSNLNEIVEKLERFLSFGKMCVNDDDINMAIKLNNTINDILSSIKPLKLSESMKTVHQSMEVIKNILDQILQKHTIITEKENEKQILLKGKAETLLHHMDHFIEIIETVEEVSAVIKLEDLKESANIVRELQQSLIKTELTSEDCIQNASKAKIKEEQAEIAQRLHKALVSVQIQALESPPELAPTVNEDIGQQIIEVVSDLQNDLIALAGTNLILGESLITTAFESNIEYQEQNAKLVLEKQDQLKEIATEEIRVETKQLTEYNELDNESELQQITDSNTNKRLNLLNQLKEGEKDTLNAELNLDELKPPDRDETKSEKVTTINEILTKNLKEYISENTLAIIGKLSHPLHSEHIKKTVEIAEQLWNTILSEIASSEKNELSNFSVKQIELILSLNEAILLMYQTTIEESQELENKVGKDKVQSFKNVVTNLRSVLQEIINNIKSLPSVSDIDEFQQEETNIKELVEHIVSTQDKEISDSYQIENVIDLNCNIANNNLLQEVIERLEERKNLLSNESDNYNQDKKVAIETEELYTENKDVTIIGSTIDQSIQCMEFDTEPGKKKTSVNKDELINHIKEYFSEETVNVINKVSSFFKLEDIQQSVQIAHQLYDSVSSSESEIHYMSTQQLKLALLLEKTVSLLLESTVQETDELKLFVGKSELLKTNNLMDNLRNDLKILIEITLNDTNLSSLDLDELKVLITKEPFKCEIIVSNISDAETSNETISKNISCIKQLDLPISSVPEAIHDSINYAVEAEITSVISNDKNLMPEKIVEVSPEDLKEKLQSEDLTDDNSIIKLEILLKEVNDMVEISCDDNLEVIQNSLDEVQTIIMKMKSDFDGSIGDAINETLEDLECNVRSFQLQIIENSPQVLLKEACVNLQTLVAHISELNEVEDVLKPMTIKVANDVLDECSDDARQTIEFIEKVSCSGSNQHLEHIISNLNQIKDSIKSLRLKFLTNADTLIMGGVEIVQSLDQIEERIFCLEKDLESEKNVDPITRDNILSAVHCVYGSISNMRGTISCVQKKYMYENYGKPSRYFLTSIKNVMELIKKDKNTKHWKQFAQSLRKVLNHFEDIKFYINFDKTARLPSDAAFTKIILGELVSVLSREVLQSVGSLDPEVIKNVYDCIKCINRKLSDIEHNTILEVKEKIPIFNDLSVKILDLTKIINKFMQNEMMIENDKDKIKSDLTPSQATNLEKENINEKEADENTKTDNIKLLCKDNVNIELTQNLPEILKDREQNINGEVVVTKQGIPQDVSTDNEILSEALKEKSENANILQHQIGSEVLQSTENEKMSTNTDFEDKYIVQTEELPLEKDLFSQTDINLMEENNTDTIHALEKKEFDLPETTYDKKVSEENQEKINESDLLIKKHTTLQKTDDQKSSEIVSNDNNDKYDNQVDLENNNAEKQIQHQETKQVEEGKICDESKKEFISDVEENKESLETKDYKENDSESKDQFKKFDSKEQDKQEEETMLSVAGKVEESVNNLEENANMPKDKSATQKKEPNEQSNKYDNGEEQNIANVEKKKELIKSLENKENEESNSGSEDQFKKVFEEQEQKHKETQFFIENAVQESVSTSVENADMPYDTSTPQEIKQIVESTICDDDEKQFITIIEGKTDIIIELETKEYGERSSGKEDQFKKELKEQDQHQIENVGTVESKVAESVNTSVENLNMPIEKSKPQEYKQIVESTIGDNDEKRIITKVEEETEGRKESGTKGYGEKSSDKEDQCNNELMEQQQQIESESTIESKVVESVNTSVEHVDTPTEKSKPQEMMQIVESTICDNDEKQVITNVEEKTEVIKELGIKECGERSSGKEDQFKKELKEQEQLQIENVATVESKVAESVNTSVENLNMPIETCEPQEMKQTLESTIGDNVEKQVITNVEEKTEVIKELGIKECGERSSGKEDQFKKELKEQEQQQIESESTIESKVVESVNTSVENLNMPIEKCEPQEMKQTLESTIGDNDEKQVITNVEEKTEVIKELGIKECGERSSGKEGQFKKELKEQEQQQIESESTIESKVVESVNTSVEHVDTPTEKSKPQEMMQIVESTICDNDEKQVITNVEEKTGVIKELGIKECGERSSGKEGQFKKELKEQEQQQIESESTIESKVAESVNTSVEHVDTPTEKSKPQEMMQIVESTICDNDEKQVITNVEEKTEVIKELGIKECGERSSGKEGQFKKELKVQEQQQIESESTIESKVAESVNTSVEHVDTPTEKSKPQEMMQIVESTICDNDEKQVITNVEEKTEVIKELGIKECGERSSGKEGQFKKELKEQEKQQIENVVTIKSEVAEFVNTSVENINIQIDESKSQEMKQIVESTISDNCEKQDISNNEEMTGIIQESGTKEYEQSSSGKEDQFKKEDRVQEPQQIPNVATIEGKAAESVNTSVEHIDTLTEKSKSHEMKQIIESTQCDNDEKQVITKVEEKTEVRKESKIKEYGESDSDKEGQFKKEFKEQEQQQTENVSSIESKVAESVNTSVENINMPIEKSKSQEMKQIVDSTIGNNDEKLIITKVEEKTEVIKESGIKEYGERSSDKEDQFKKELKEQEQQKIESLSTIDSVVAESVNTSVENINMAIEKSKPQEYKQIVESTICDNDEKQVITKVKEKTEVIQESGTKEYAESSSDKEDQFKKELKKQEQQQIENVVTIESKAAEYVNTSMENIIMTIDKFKPQEMKQVSENTICDNGEKQVVANINEKQESIKTTKIKEYEESSSSEDDQYKKEYEEQKQQQTKTVLTIESTVAESLNTSAEDINMPLEKSIIQNGNEKCIEVTKAIEPFEEIAELQTQEDNSVLSNVEIKGNTIKEKAEIVTEIKKHLVESSCQEKSSDNQERNTEKPIYEAMETSSNFIELETETEKRLDKNLTKNDDLYKQVQEEVKKHDESKVDSNKKKCIIEKENDTKSIEVSKILTYKDDSTEAQFSQQEITEIDDTKNDENLGAIENINTININGKHKTVLEIDIEKQPSDVDRVTKRQDDLLYEEDVESTNSNEHIIQQECVDILDLSQPKEKENNQDIYKTKDNKSATSDIDIPVQLHTEDKIKEETLNQIDNKTSTEHIDNRHMQKEKNNKKEIKKKAQTKKEEQNLIEKEMKDLKLKKSIDAKQVGVSDIEEKMRENIRKTKVEIITDLGEIDQEVTCLNDSLRIEENAEIEIETDPFRNDIDMRRDFSIKECITQVANKSEDELKLSTHKLVQNSSYLIEETCEKIENNTDSERSEFKENTDETSHACKDKENLTEMKKNKEICSKSQNTKLENELSNEQKELNNKRQESIKATQNKEVVQNQDYDSQSKTAIAKKDEAEINIDNKQESISLINKEYQDEVKILSDVDNQSDSNIIDTNLDVDNEQILKQSNEILKSNKNNLSKEEVNNLKIQEENIDKNTHLEHFQVDKLTHILEQAQQVEVVFDNVENSEKVLANTEEYSKVQEELKSHEQVQDRLLTKEISKREEGKKSESKQQKEKRRFKNLPETSKQEAENEKSEVKPQENENNGLDEGKKIDDMNLNVVNVALPSTKSDGGNDIFIKEDKQNQDKQENIEQKRQIKTEVQHDKLETKTGSKFLYEEEVENKKETDNLTRQINKQESIQQNENKKEEYVKELNRKERQDSDEENKIKDIINLEEKVFKDKYFEKIKDYEQLKDGTTSIKKDTREGQKSKEQRKGNNIIADTILTNVESEFSRPPGYVAKPYGIEDTVSQIQINNNKAQTIYKAQTLRHESQLRYSMPPHIDQALDTIEGRCQIREKTKAASECRSTLSEKRCSSSRDIKRKPVFSTFLTDRTAVESSRVKLTCSVLTNTDPRITWYKNGVQIENKHKFRSKFVDGLITLEILNAIPSDSGEYSCSVENENGLVTSSANLKVYPSFEASPIPPTFTRSIRDNYHLAENELVLECRIRGQPLPTITWLKNDKPIISERYQAHYLADGVCRLTISNPTTEDSGKYTCKAESSVWSDEITHDVYFTGKKSRASPNIATVEKLHFSRLGLESRRPHFTNVLSDHKVVTGGTIGLQVEIRGSPTRVEWLREGHSVTELYRNAQTYVDHDIYTLALSDVTEKESGLYTCRAYSNQGNVDMNASITVIQPNQHEGKPASIVSRPAKDVIISVGEDLNISFRLHGEPKAKVFLMKGIRDLSNSQRVCKMTSDDYVKFTLKRTVVSDAGTYCIFAKNAYGCDRAFVTVVIRQRASSDNLISDWTYPMDDLAISCLDRNYKSVPDRIPSEPSVVDGGNNWISLAWPKSDHQSRAPILAYKVESWLLGKEGGARWAELGITPRNSFDAFNLKQGEEYHFRVTPRNRYGWGESVQTSVPIGIGLAGDRPEFVEILPGQLKVLVGEKAILRCSFTGKPMPEIVWMKNGHEIEEEIGRVIIQINNFQTSLQIEEVTINDEGRYSCEATNIHGRSSTYARMAVITDRKIWQADAKLKRERSAGIDGEYPPQFTMRLRDRRVQATYPVRLTCQVVGNPSPVVKWFKNDEEIVIGGRYTASQDEYFYTLEIAPTTLEDGGVYEAMARNCCGAVSCRCSLVVDKGIRAYIAPEFCCGLEPLYRLSEGEELRISAIVEAYPSVGVTWYRDGVRLRPSRRAIMTLDRDGQIELALASVTGRDAGVYTCTASNEVGMASTSGKVEILSGEYVIEKASAPPIVISSDVPYSKEPMFIRKPRSSEAREGDTVIIECEVTGDPKPDVYWLRDFLKPDYYRDSSHFKRIGAGPAYRFEIPHAKLDYTGAYSIVAKNIHGETKAIISLQILAKDPTCGDDVHNIKYGRVEVIPRFDKELTDLLCYDGDAVEFECSVSGNPDPDIRWLHYNEIIPECPDFETSYDVGTARLKIKQVTAEDEGTYTCEASNNLGKTSSNACLVVYPPGEPNTLSTRLRRPPALLSAASTPRSTPRATPARSMSRTPGPEARRLCSPSREIAPKFYTYPFNRVAEEGDTVVFQCAVKGLPQPWATWDKDGIIITPSARITIKEKDEMFRILEIEQVTIEDVGLYRISLENDYGRAEASARLEVITQKGKFYGSTRSFSVSPRKTLPYRRRTPSFSK